MRAQCILAALLTALPCAVLPPAAAQSTPAFGPKQYAQIALPAQTFTETFPHCGGGQQCRMIVVNGNADGSDGVSSASISLNGVPVFGPGDFRQRPARVMKRVALADKDQLRITLDSQRGGFVTLEVECAPPPAIMSAGAPEYTVRSGMLTIALPIANTGAGAAPNVTVTAITLGGGTLAAPTLPFPLGTIAPGASGVLHARFSGDFHPGAAEILNVNGRYTAESATYCFSIGSRFTVPPEAPASERLGVTTAAPKAVTGGRFPHQPLNFPDTVNSPRWRVPTLGVTTFQTNPNGLRISIDGGAPRATPFSVNLSSGAHKIATAVTQAGPEGTRYAFASWSDRGAATHEIRGGADSTTYTATFVTEYRLDISVVPTGGGRVSATPSSPEGDGYYLRGARVTIKALPNASRLFAGFAGALTGTNNPQTLVMTAPASVVAQFTAR